MKKFILATAIAMASSTLFAAPLIINLSATPPTPNAGKDSGTYSYAPVYETLDAGTYTIGEVGKAGGGLYDAYSVFAPTGTNTAWTDSQWYVSTDDGTSAIAGRAPLKNRYTSAADALAAYSALDPLTFTLTETTKVAFYLNDTAYPYFGDDSEGVSLGLNSVPEPATASLVGMAAIAFGVTRRRRSQK